MLNIFKKKPTFEQSYPIISNYIEDDNLKKKLLNDEEFKRKYSSNEYSINIFIKELSKHYDKEYIIEIFNLEILLLNDELLVDLIVGYLNLNEVDKSNKEYFIDFNKKCEHVDLEAKEKDEIEVLTNRYNEIKNGNEVIGNIKLDLIYDNLDLNDKKYIFNILNNNSLVVFNNLFKENLEDKDLEEISKFIHYLNYIGLDYVIINKDVCAEIGDETYIPFIYNLMTNAEKSKKIIKNMKSLIETKRYNLIMRMITNNLVSKVSSIKNDEINELNDKEIMEGLIKRKYKRAS